MQNLKTKQRAAAFLVAIMLIITTFSPAYASETALAEKYTTPEEYLSFVKSQDGENCWAFASISCFETLLLRNNVPLDMQKAESYYYENLLDIWSSAPFQNNPFGWLRNYKEGGFYKMALGFYTSWAQEEYGLLSAQYVEATNDESVKAQIVEHGVVASSFQYSGVFESSNSVNYFMPENAVGYNTVGHTALIVGWDDNYLRERFKNPYGKLPKENGAWLCKNSWGNYNSLGGYFWISYEDANLLKDDFDSSFSMDEYLKITDDLRIYQNEIYGATYNLEYTVPNDGVTFINVFDFNPYYNTLDKVVFEQRSPGTDFNIFYIPIDSATKSPTTDKLKWVYLYTETADYSGYICADLEDTTLPAGKGAIGIQIAGNSNISDVSFGTCEYIYLISGASSYLYFKPNAMTGKSYILDDGGLTDLMDYYESVLDDPGGATFVIKAITRLRDDYIGISGDADMDTEVTIADATQIQKYLALLLSFNSYEADNADFNADGEVTIGDVTDIQKLLAKII